MLRGLRQDGRSRLSIEEEKDHLPPIIPYGEPLSPSDLGLRTLDFGLNAVRFRAAFEVQSIGTPFG